MKLHAEKNLLNHQIVIGIRTADFFVISTDFSVGFTNFL